MIAASALAAPATGSTIAHSHDAHSDNSLCVAAYPAHVHVATHVAILHLHPPTTLPCAAAYLIVGDIRTLINQQLMSW